MTWKETIGRYGPVLLPGERWMRKAFIALFILAAVLRFWDLPHLPYTHDELSALVRIYPTLGETIQRGVIELDTHPPGVQVFEWFWTKVFTKEEADVKLPFILMDLLALLFLYRFALAWTGASPALVLTALMATIQYSVLYGQIARPYAAGLFTTALLADQLTRYLAFGTRRMLIGVGIAALLSAYTHHFALLLAALMVATGWFLISREQRRAYAIMCGIAIVLYLPNIPIFLKQLGEGGLSEWLPAPDGAWFPKYGWFIANDNVFLAGILIACVVASVILTIRSGRVAGPARWFLFAWGVIPLAIGFAYSVWRAPVLQYSVVLFSFPYIVLFLLQGLVHVQRKAVLVGCAILACVSVYSLVNTRLHYELFYRSKYEVIAREAIEANKTLGTDKVLVLIDAPDHMIRFYYDLWRVSVNDFPFVQLKDRFLISQVDSILQANKGRTVIFGQSNGSVPEHLALIQQHFPELVERQDLIDGQVFRFTDGPVQMQWFDRDTIASITPEQRMGPWKVSDGLSMYTDTVPNGAFWEFAYREFGLGIDLPLDSIVLDPQDQIEVIATVIGWSANSEASVVADVKHGDSTVFYRTGRLEPAHRPHEVSPMIVTVCPADMKGDRLHLLTYIYNPNKEALRVSRVDILRRSANPVRYGTLEPVPWHGRFPAK
ncbi:MAG: glycosyltransferase family 39 protein [Flavobacteriales bacterium]|nr:glycosyltransferase family 39 protein [Flavobacteriales bacterium]